MIKNIYNIKFDTDTCWKLCIIFALTSIALILPEAALATNTTSTNTTLDNTICKVVNTLTGRTGKAVATIGVFFLGIGLFLGKMSWATALAIGLGIAAIFGAGTVINWIGGTGATSASC